MKKTVIRAQAAVAISALVVSFGLVAAGAHDVGHGGKSATRREHE